MSDARQRLLDISPFHQMKANLACMSKAERDKYIDGTADPDTKDFLILVRQAIEMAEKKE